jgi:hypothetical protein
VGPKPLAVASDGPDLWVTSGSQVTRVRASDGSVLGTWSGASGADGVLIARGLIYVIGETSPRETLQHRS